ncbi:unnamed protein product, partial [Brachionus calyciflorus]
MFNRTLYNYFFISINSSDTSHCDSNDLNVYQPTYEYEKIINGKQGYILWGIVFVIIAFLGLIGNIFTIMVLKREAVVSTLNTLLIALAISDILAPMANVLLAISFYHLSIPYENSVNFLIFNDILRHFIQPLSTMFTMSSSWILTITTLFRLIAVMLPFKARTLINKRFAIICLFVIFGFGLISILPLYASLIRKIKCTKDNKIQYVAFDMEVTSEFMAKYYILMIQSLSFYLPWCLALILWLFLLKALKQSEKCFNVSFTPKDSPTNVPMLDSSKHHFIFAHNNHESSSIHSHIPVQNTDSRINNAQTRLKSYNRITLMVVVLTFTNLICRLFTFVFIFEVIYNEYLKSTYVDGIDEEVTSFNSTETNQIFLNSRNYFPNFLAYSLLLNNIFLCINHSCNIIIYTVTNPRFRKNLMALLRCGDPVKEYKQNFLNDKHVNSTLNRHTIALNETYFHNN